MTNPNPTHNRSIATAAPLRLRRPLLKSAAIATVAALSLASLATLASLAFAPQQAQAATYGAGYSDAATGSSFGNFVLPDGSKGYCIDPGADVPTGATSDSGITTAIKSVGVAGAHARTLTAAELASINAVVTRHGQTDDNNTAAAVALTVWSISNPAAFAEETAPFGDNYKMTLAPAPQRAAIVALTAQFRAEAAAYVPPASATGNATMHLETNTTDNYEGTLVIDSLSTPGTGAITLTNGIFTTTNAASITGTFAAGTRLPIRGIVAPGEASGYTISAVLDLTNEHSTSPAADLHLWSTGARQQLVSAGSTIKTTLHASASDQNPRSALFAPVATTRALSVWLQEGDDLVDAITTTTAADSRGRNNPWPRTGAGAYFPVIFQNVAYGPFATRPSLSPTVPATAPVAATQTFSTGTTGPASSYQTRMIGAAKASGYYTFVVSVNYANQAPATQAFLSGPLTRPASTPYAWSDSFGQKNETSFVLPQVTTTAQTLTSALSTVSDSVTVTGQVPAEGLDVTFAGYRQLPGSTVPLCTPATLAFASSTPTAINSAGTFSSQTFDVPAGSSGTIYWVATTVVRGTSTLVDVGECGDPTEQTIIAEPTITTTPPTQTASGSTAHDLVTVNGWVAAGTTTTVALYRQAAGSTTLSCTPATLAATLESIKLDAGLNSSKNYVTVETAALAPGHYGFVQTTLDRSGAVVSVSGCHDELFIVSAAPPLATTGGDQLSGALMGGGSAGALIAAGLAFAATGRRRRATEPKANR